MMDLPKELNLRDPLNYFLQIACTDLHCYGESFGYIDDAFDFQQACCDSGMKITNELNQKLKDFTATADTEKYTIDVGLVGMGAAVQSYQIYDLKLLIQDHYFINPITIFNCLIIQRIFNKPSFKNFIFFQIRINIPKTFILCYQWEISSYV